MYSFLRCCVFWNVVVFSETLLWLDPHCHHTWQWYPKMLNYSFTVSNPSEIWKPISTKTYIRTRRFTETLESFPGNSSEPNNPTASTSINFRDLTLHAVTGTFVRFSSCESHVSPVLFQSTSYCSQLLCCSNPELLTTRAVSLRLSDRLQLHACLLSTTAESRHQWSGVKPWKTMPTYTAETGIDNRQSRAKIRFWQRPKVPASSKRSSKVAITIVIQVLPVWGIKINPIIYSSAQHKWEWSACALL